MSRIGKQPINVPTNVEVKIEGTEVIIKGPKGTLSQTISSEISVQKESQQLRLKPVDDNKQSYAKWGLFRVLIDNMIVGVVNGYQRDLEIVGVGYKAELKGKDLVVSVGYSHNVTVKAVDGVSFTVDGGTKISVKGIDKQKVGQIAADIRKIKKPEPYKGKGIRYAGEVIRKKAGKTGTK